MSHCISIYLINKSDLRTEKIDSVINGKLNIGEIKWIELDANILATTYIPNIKKFGIDKTIAKVETDYFGGMGYQSAKLFINNKKVFDHSDEYFNSKKYLDSPINKVLEKLRVVRKGELDEFDTVGLGKYRNNNDF
jgi:hypothetical protein